MAVLIWKYDLSVHNMDKYSLKFEWIRNFCQFVGMPNGYSDAMRIFALILKPVFGHLREECHLSVTLVNESCLQEDTGQECMNNI